MRPGWMAQILIVRILVLTGMLLIAPLAPAQVFELFPYELVSAYGQNNERDVNAKACDLVQGCFDQVGEPCSDEPNRPCDLATVSAGRCSAGNEHNSYRPQASPSAGRAGPNPRVVGAVVGSSSGSDRRSEARPRTGRGPGGRCSRRSISSVAARGTSAF